jgi:response regulator RpfG family c-di-GMP phosphodiesterase
LNQLLDDEQLHRSALHARLSAAGAVLLPHRDSSSYAIIKSSIRPVLRPSLAGLLAATIGVIVLIGWATDDVTLQRVMPQFVAMNPMTATCFVVLGLSLLQPAFLNPFQLTAVRRTTGTFAFSVGLLKLADMTVGTGFGIDGYLFASKVGSGGGNPMAESTAASLMLLGASMNALTIPRKRPIFAGQIFAAGSMLLAFVAAIGYLYGELSFYSMGYFPVALHSAIAALIVAVGLLSLHPHRGAMRVLTSSSLGGSTARKLLPSVIGIPLALGLLWLLAQDTGSVGPVTGVALFVTSNILVLVTIVALISRQLHVVARKLHMRTSQLEKAQLRLNAAANLLKYKNHSLEAEVASRTAELQAIQEVTILSLASLAESRDNETGNHIRRTQHYVRLLAKHLQSHPRFAAVLTDSAVELICKSAPLHDIGKVGISDQILLKPGSLTPDELEAMKAHTTIGRDAIERAEKTLGSRVQFLQFAKEMAYSHQEKWDGSGYPRGISGENIPVSARLMAVADVYDALVSRRVYKAALSHAEAVAIIVAGRGTHFDPDIVDAFSELSDEFQKISLQYAD